VDMVYAPDMEDLTQYEGDDSSSDDGQAQDTSPSKSRRVDGPLRKVLVWGVGGRVGSTLVAEIIADILFPRSVFNWFEPFWKIPVNVSNLPTLSSVFECDVSALNDQCLPGTCFDKYNFRPTCKYSYIPSADCNATQIRNVCLGSKATGVVVKSIRLKVDEILEYAKNHSDLAVVVLVRHPVDSLVSRMSLTEFFDGTEDRNVQCDQAGSSEVKRLTRNIRNVMCLRYEDFVPSFSQWTQFYQSGNETQGDNNFFSSMRALFQLVGLDAVASTKEKSAFEDRLVENFKKHFCNCRSGRCSDSKYAYGTSRCPKTEAEVLKTRFHPKLAPKARIQFHSAVKKLGVHCKDFLSYFNYSMDSQHA